MWGLALSRFLVLGEVILLLADVHRRVTVILKRLRTFYDIQLLGDAGWFALLDGWILQVFKLEDG